MISIKKYLDARSARPTHLVHPNSAPDIATLNARYRATLLLFGVNAALDGSSFGTELRSKLASIELSLRTDLSAKALTMCGDEVRDCVDGWGQRSAADAKNKAGQISELLLALAGTAEVIGYRDTNYAAQVSKMTGRLEEVEHLNDLPQIRLVLAQHISDLKSNVAEMATESNNIVANLRAQISLYEIKLKSVEDISLKDELTQTANRRGIESFISSRVDKNSGFSIIMFDLNGFKQINDTFGHIAGDSILKQFSMNLRESVREGDLVGRWGGDEFIVVMTCNEAKTRLRLGVISNRVFTKYGLQEESSTLISSVNVDAAAGVAEWMPGETLQQLIARADTEMYFNKQSRR